MKSDKHQRLIRVRPPFRILAGLIALLGMWTLYTLWRNNDFQLDPLTLFATSLYTILGVYIALNLPIKNIYASPERGGIDPNDVGKFLSSFTWGSAFFYVGFSIFAAYLLYLVWHRELGG